MRSVPRVPGAAERDGRDWFLSARTQPCGKERQSQGFEGVCESPAVRSPGSEVGVRGGVGRPLPRSLAMRPAARRGLLLAWSLAVLPSLAVSWEIVLSDLQEKDVDEFSSSGFQCPTCLAVMGRECDTTLKWCAADKIKCFEFSGIIKTGINNISFEMKKCIRADLCRETPTSYLGFPITNRSGKCGSALRNGAEVRPPAHVFLFVLLGKLLP